MKRLVTIRKLSLLAALLPVLAHARPAGSDNPILKNTIEGSVVSAANGRLIPWAKVFLRNTKKPDDVTSTRSDDHGHFLFSGMEEGTYQLLAEKEGFFADTRHSPIPAPVDVASDAHLEGLLVRLQPYAAVTGRIVDEHEDPLQGVQVRLLATEYFRGRKSLTNVGAAVTDDRGDYRIFHVRPGNYLVEADFDPRSGSEFGQMPVRILGNEPTYLPVFFPATGDLRQAQKLPVAAGAEVRANFAFFSVPSVSMEGKVINGLTGQPMDKPSVVVYFGEAVSGITRKVELLDHGNFMAQAIGPGIYTIVTGASDGREQYSDTRVVEVGSGGLRNLEIVVMPDLDFKGQVRFEGIDHPELSRVAVEFALPEKNSSTFRVSASKPDFEFGGKLHPGDHYRVTVPNLPKDYYLKSVLVAGHETPVSDVAIFAKDTEIQLVISPAGGHIEGVAKNSKGEPVSGYIALAPDLDRITPELIRSTHSDSNGGFELRGVAPGNYKLFAWEKIDMNELLNQPDLLRNYESDALLLSVQENGRFDLQIKPIPEP